MASVEFEGQTFELKTGKMNGLVMAEFFAATADQDGDSELTPDLLIALLQESVAAKDWRRFLKLGRKTEDFWDKALETVFKARVDAAAAATGDFPTTALPDSSDGPTPIDLKSGSLSDAKVLELAGGRVDVYGMLKQAQQAQRRAS